MIIYLAHAYISSSTNDDETKHSTLGEDLHFFRMKRNDKQLESSQPKEHPQLHIPSSTQYSTHPKDNCILHVSSSPLKTKTQPTPKQFFPPLHCAEAAPPQLPDPLHVNEAQV